jgi:hypothetical protein
VSGLSSDRGLANPREEYFRVATGSWEQTRAAVMARRQSTTTIGIHRRTELISQTRGAWQNSSL